MKYELEQVHIESSYYKVVVIRVPLQGQNATINKVLWIGYITPTAKTVFHRLQPRLFVF